MKNQNIFLATALTMFVMSSACKKDKTPQPTQPVNGTAVNFSASINGQIKTKAVNDAWEANDQIGVFMKTGTALSNVLAANKAYKTTGDGTFNPSATDQTIYFPEDGKTVDFIAYYPLKSTLTTNTYAVDVNNQSNQAAIDLLYANNATGLSKTSSVASLVFSHQLSKVEFTVKKGTGVTDLTGLAATISGLNTKADFDLATGVLSNASQVADLNAKVNSSTTITAEAIVVPTADASTAAVNFTLPGSKFKLSLAAGTKFEAGKKYTYEVELRNGVAGTPVAVAITATITNWTDVPSGSYVVDQDKDTTTPPVTGTEETLFTETFGVGAATNKPKVNAYTGWANSSFTFSDSYGTTDLRTISAYPDNIHAWFPATKDASMVISGIKISGYTKIKLKYELAPNASSASSVTNVNVITVKVNGVAITVPSHQLTNADNNKFSVVELSDIAVTGDNTIEFFGSAAANTLGLRLDNVTIIGVK